MVDPLDLAEVLERYRQCTSPEKMSRDIWEIALMQSVRDVPRLVAEVKRLRAACELDPWARAAARPVVVDESAIVDNELSEGEG